MRIRGRHYAVDWGHLIFATLIAVAVLWYLLNAAAVSVSVNNLLLVAPTAIFALLLYCCVLPQCFRPADEAPRHPELAALTAGRAAADRQETVRVLSLGAVLGLFVFSLDQVGFDVAIWLFTLGGMFICGERKALPLLLYPLALAFLVVHGFRAMMPFPMPTAIL
jgi:hypothetical protein